MTLITIHQSFLHFGECKQVLLLLLTTAVYKPMLDHVGTVIFSLSEGGAKSIAKMPWPDWSLWIRHWYDVR